MKQLTREMKVAGRANAKDRSVPVVITTAAPVDRGSYDEILSCDPAHVDLTRAPLPLIVSHDAQTLPIGTVDNITLDGNKMRGIARFGKSARADEILQDVIDGVIRSVSVGYSITEQLKTVGRAITFAWQPFEVSAVAVPADSNAGFYRSQSHQRTPPKMDVNQKRSEDIASLGEAYSKYVKQSDVAEAIRSGMTVDAFQSLIMQRMESGHTNTASSYLDMTRKEVKRYSLGRALQAQVTGDWREAGFELECSRALEKATGRRSEGILLPSQAFYRDFNVGTASEAGNLIPTDLRGDMYVDALRNALIMSKLGVRILTGLSGNIDIPRKLTPSSLAMLTEIGSASETAPATAKLSLTPKRTSAYVEVSKQALIQSPMSLEGMIRDDLLAGAAVLLESQSIGGNGTSPNILGIRNYTTIGSSTAGANGATVAWSHFVDLESVGAVANAEPTAMAGYLTNAKVRAKAKQVARGTNLDFIIPPDARVTDDGLVYVNGYKTGFTNNVPSNLTKGTSTTVCSSMIFSADWSMGVLALFGAPDVVVDPYTLAATGQVRITLNQFADFGIRQPAAFVKMDDVLTT